MSDRAQENVSEEARFEDLLEEAGRRALASAKAKGMSAEQAEEAVDEAIRRTLEELVATEVPRMCQAIKADRQRLFDRRNRRSDYAAGIARHWQQAFDLYELTLAACGHFGSEFSDARRREENPQAPVVGPVISRLQGRACRIAEEVPVLMQMGYAQGALARWRSLHEVAVVTAFLAKHGEETVQRYLAYQSVQDYWRMKDYIACARPLGLESLSSEEEESIRGAYSDVIERYGDECGQPNGWAAFALGKKRVSFVDLERDVGMSHHRIYYGRASAPVHANADGTMVSADLMPPLAGAVLTGPSPRGMADPGHAALVSLVQITTTLAALVPTGDALIFGNVILALCDEAGDAFLAAHERLEADGGRAFHESVDMSGPHWRDETDETELSSQWDRKAS